MVWDIVRAHFPIWTAGIPKNPGPTRHAGYAEIHSTLACVGDADNGGIEPRQKIASMGPPKPTSLEVLYGK